MRTFFLSICMDMRLVWQDIFFSHVPLSTPILFLCVCVGGGGGGEGSDETFCMRCYV